MTKTYAPLVMILALLAAPLAAVQQPNDTRRTAEMVRIVTEKQRERPFWFVLKATALDRIPFAYQVSRSITRPGGEAGVTADSSTSWCWAVIEGRNSGVQCRSELADLKNVNRPKPGQKFDNADRFWDEFRKAFAFETLERQSRLGRPTFLISFVPKPGYSSNRNDDAAIFPFIRGRIWIDEEDLEIARFEYDFFKDSSALVFGQILEGTRYAMDLEEQFDGFWLPTQAATELRLGVLNSSSHEEFTVRFSNYIK